MFNEIVKLITSNKTIDENGFEVEKTKENIVFADKKSVKQTEFYEAQRNGHKLDKMFIIKPYEYHGEKYIIHNEIKYKIERTYEKDTENLEIICSREV